MGNRKETHQTSAVRTKLGLSCDVEVGTVLSDHHPSLQLCVSSLCALEARPCLPGSPGQGRGVSP